MKRRIVSYTFLLIGFSLNVLSNEHVYDNPDLGFKIEKPASWYFMSQLDVSESRGRTSFDNKSFEEHVRRQARLPIVSISKYPNPALLTTVSPTVNITVSPTGIFEGRPPLDIVNAVLNVWQQSLNDLEILKAPYSTELSGCEAAAVEVSFVVGNQAGASFSVKSRLWAIPKGKYYFSIAMAGPSSGADFSEKEFSEILSAIEIKC